MAITGLGYIGVRSDRLTDWADYAGGLLGMQQVDRAGRQAAFRTDDRCQRLVVSDEPGETLAFLGWEVADKTALDAMAAKLEAAGTAIHHAPSDLADRRYVTDLIHCLDPAGNRIEFFHGPMVADDPFVPGRPISGFKMGALGMGHAVLHVDNPDAMLEFYRDILGFAVSDYALKPYPMYFLHVNGRHHSFAMIGTGRQGFHHFMVEYDRLDDVGQGFDLALEDPERIAYTLGRHTNDWMTSFYSHTPSGFFVETGWGGRVIDPATWQADEMHNGPSLWGHDRLYLPPDQRDTMRQLRLGAAEQGLQAPPVVDCPWLYQSMARQS